MDDALFAVEGDEAKMVLAQFLGQHLSEAKLLDSQIINRTPTLQSTSLDPYKIINSIPGGRSSQQPPTLPQRVVQSGIQIPTFVNASSVAPQPLPPPQPLLVEEGQFEFNFKYDVAKDIAEQLAKIDSRLKKLETKIDSLIENKSLQKKS